MNAIIAAALMSYGMNGASKITPPIVVQITKKAPQIVATKPKLVRSTKGPESITPDRDIIGDEKAHDKDPDKEKE